MKVVTGEVAAVLGIPQAKLEIEKPLDSLGIDSLMAVELVVGIEAATNIALPKMILLRPGLSVAELGGILEKEMLQLHPAEQSSVQGPDEAREEYPPTDVSGMDTAEKDHLSIDVDDLSEEEVDSMLSSLLSEGGKENE